MMPVVDNFKIDNWYESLEKSGNVTQSKMERVHELAREACAQWKRKILVQKMIHSIDADQRRAVAIEDIFDVHGVHFTTETMRIMEDGIQQSLRNFCRVLMHIIATWDASVFHKQDGACNCRRISLAVSHAPSCLWGSLDTTDLCYATVHARLVCAVDGLWNTHAKPAIEAERNRVAEGIQRMHHLIFMCDEYNKPNTGGRAVPSRFTNLYARMRQRAISALAWASGNSAFVCASGANEHTVSFRDVLDAYRAGEVEARAVMERHSFWLKCATSKLASFLKAVYSRGEEWDGWHGVAVCGHDESKPSGATSLLVVQPPSYASSYWGTSRVHCCLTPTAGAFAIPAFSQPVVRFCAILKKLVQKRFLRLDLVGVDYLRLLSNADHARYDRNVSKIVDDELIPVGHLAGIAFDVAWFADTRAPVVYSSFKSRVPDAPWTIAEDEQANKLDTDDASTAYTELYRLECKANAPPALPAPVPEGVILDHCLMGALVFMARSNVSSDHTGPYCNTFHVGASDAEGFVRRWMGLHASTMTPACLRQRITGALKMFSAALAATGMQSSFGVHTTHPRVKKLKVSWRIEEQHRVTNLSKIAHVAEQIGAYLHHGVELPTGVEWSISARSRRRRKARDEQCCAAVLLSRCDTHTELTLDLR
jgi:hypothetical protein